MGGVVVVVGVGAVLVEHLRCFVDPKWRVELVSGVDLVLVRIGGLGGLFDRVGVGVLVFIL